MGSFLDHGSFQAYQEPLGVFLIQYCLKGYCLLEHLHQEFPTLPSHPLPSLSLHQEFARNLPSDTNTDVFFVSDVTLVGSVGKSSRCLLEHLHQVN